MTLFSLLFPIALATLSAKADIGYDCSNMAVSSAVQAIVVERNTNDNDLRGIQIRHVSQRKYKKGVVTKFLVELDVELGGKRTRDTVEVIHDDSRGFGCVADMTAAVLRSVQRP